MPSKYNQEYYFIRPTSYLDLPNLPDLTEADANTRNRDYSFEAQVVGTAPLMFTNYDKASFAEEGLGILNPVPPVLFCGGDILVTTEIRNELLKHNIPHLHMHPSVYIHDDDEWYENYWFCTFVERFDCWNRETSDYMREDYEEDEPLAYSMRKYDLNTELLDNTPLEQRLLFKMGATFLPYITVHESLKYLFESHGSQTIEVTDWPNEM